MSGYSVAIRTLGTSPDTLKEELISLHNQSLLPEKICIFIAKGYKKPEFHIGIEEYIEVPKGMVAQRALDYKGIKSEYLLLLDDDVVLSSDSAEKLIRQLEENNADCVAADTFANHKMSVTSKLRAIISNFVFPRFNQKWAFKLHANGSFTYINNPINETYPSQSAAGPASLWKKSSLLAIHLEHEKWLDDFGFAYGDDDLEFYKLYINGGKLIISFNSGIINLDSKSSSSTFQKDPKKFTVRSMSNLMRWHRMQYLPRTGFGRIKAFALFGIKQIWLSAIHIILSIITLDKSPMKYISGIKEGVNAIKSDKYKTLPEYNQGFILDSKESISK